MYIDIEAIKAREARVKASAERVTAIFNARGRDAIKARLGEMPHRATRGTLHRLSPFYAQNRRPLTATQFYNIA